MAMTPIKFEIGQRFGHLTVVSENRIGRAVMCKCDCGKETPVNASELHRNKIKSCGCRRWDWARAATRKSPTKSDGGMTIRQALGLNHGDNLGKHRTYRIWKGMKSRCAWDGHEATERYKGKGVVVCDRWMDFMSFLQDMGHPPTEQHSIDRIDTDGSYEPGNCRWATKLEQSRNRTMCIYIETPIGKVTLTEAAAFYGVEFQTAYERYKKGWPIAAVFSKESFRGKNRKGDLHA